MKRIWDIPELEEHWTLSTAERQAAQDNKTDAGRLGFALLLGPNPSLLQSAAK